jgi:hypothetical protein
MDIKTYGIVRVCLSFFILAFNCTFVQAILLPDTRGFLLMGGFYYYLSLYASAATIYSDYIPLGFNSGDLLAPSTFGRLDCCYAMFDPPFFTISCNKLIEKVTMIIPD